MSLVLSFLNNSSFLSRSGLSSNGNWENTGEGTNNRGVVDDMVSGVGAGVLLDSHLRDMVNLVVDLIANMLDNWGSSNMNSWSSNSMVCSRSNSSSDSGSSLNLNSFDFSRGGSNNMMGNWGSICISGSWNNSRGSLNLNSLDFPM